MIKAQEALEFRVKFSNILFVSVWGGGKRACMFILQCLIIMVLIIITVSGALMKIFVFPS